MRWQCVIKVRLLNLFFLLIGFGATAQHVGIGSGTQELSAILQINGTTRGVLIPRMSAVSEISIASPAKGLFIYQTNQQRFRYNAGTPAAPAFSNIYNFDDFQNGYGQWWNIAGTNTAPTNRFYGTTNAVDFVLKVQNQQVAKFGHNTYNVALGLDAGRFSLGGQNILIGRRTQAVNDAGIPLATSHQIAIGDSALHFFRRTPITINNSDSRYSDFNFSGTNGYNIAIGKSAMQYNTLGAFNIAIGHFAMLGDEDFPTTNDAVFNVAIGNYALNEISYNQQNVAVGHQALQTKSSIRSSVGIGYGADANLIYGSAEDPIGQGFTLLGASTKVERTTSNITVVGHGARAIGVSGSDPLINLMVLGSTDVTKWAFGRSTTDANVALQVGTNNTNGNGAYLTRTGTWVNVSDRNKKEDFTQIDNELLLEKVEALPITRWQYKAGGGWHIGPMAQDFKAIFNLGSSDDKSINTVDPVGIAMAAAQALLAETETLKKRTEALEKK